MTHWSKNLPRDACKDAVAWCHTQSTYEIAWATCERADWLLWLAGRLCPGLGTPEHHALVLAACDCAETALVHVPAGEDRPRLAIETTRAWVRGEATIDDVRAAQASAAQARAAWAASWEAARAAWKTEAAAWVAVEAARGIPHRHMHALVRARLTLPRLPGCERVTERDLPALAGIARMAMEARS